MPKAAPLPDKPPLHLTGGYLAIASPDSISETSFSIPAVRALRSARRLSTIAIIANSATAPLWRKVAEVNLVIEHSSDDSARKIVKSLKDSNLPFDSSIAWENGAAAQAFAKLGIKQRLGYPADKLAKLLTDPVKVIREAGPIEHRVRHYLLFVEKLGLDPFQPSNFTPPPRPPAPAKAILALAPGSDFGTAAEWPLDRFVELAGQVPSEVELVILPSPDRPEPASELAKALNLPVTYLDGDDLLEFLATCRALVTNDGSLPHLAALVGTAALVFFGPNDPEWRRPLGRIHKVVRRHVPCSGCLLNKCPLDHRCMSEITVASVALDLQSLLKDE